MIEAAVLAQLCADVYTETPKTFLHVWNFGGTVAAHEKIGDTDVVVFRGSLTPQDWVRNLEVFPVWDSRIGFVHGGFLTGVNDVLIAMSLLVGPKVVVTGHSLGGARARILAALLAYHTIPALQCCVFGSPRPGFANMRRVLEKSGTLLQSYRNREDPVPLVPFMGGLYEHTDQWVSLDAPAAPDDLEPLRDHHMVHYMEGLGKLVQSPVPVPA